MSILQVLPIWGIEPQVGNADAGTRRPQVRTAPQLEMAMIIRQNERFRSVLWVRVIKNKYFCKLKLSNNTYKNIHLHSCLSK